MPPPCHSTIPSRRQAFLTNQHHNTSWAVLEYISGILIKSKLGILVCIPIIAAIVIITFAALLVVMLLSVIIIQTITDLQDVVGPVIKMTVDNLKALVKESDMLTKAALDGNLGTSGNAEDFSGGYKNIEDRVHILSSLFSANSVLL
jgi:hypothetical protein